MLDPLAVFGRIDAHAERLRHIPERPGLATWLGAAFCAAFAWKLARGTIGLLLLAWPALFVSLGWNFLEYAFDPPEGGGIVGGWLFCGVVFWLMGVPALFALPRILRGIDEHRRLLILCVLLEATLAGAVGGWFLVEAVAS